MSLLSKFGYDELYFDELLIQYITSDSKLFTDSQMHNNLLQIIMHGGKRIRPLFVLLAGDLQTDVHKKDLYDAAVAIELMHIASLIHDDIIDQSTTRHSLTTLHEQYDLKTAVYLGNYVLNKSLELFSQFKIPKLHQEIAKVMNYLCLGELNQQDNNFNFDLSLEDYIHKSYQKTGALISLSLMIGGLVSGLNSNTIQRLSNIGSNIGIAYQIKDDILDFTSSSQKIGKPVGYDLKNGIITLPTIFALEDSVLKDDLLSLTFETENSRFDQLCERIKNSEYIQKSNELCLNYINQSKDMISHLPNHEHQLLKIINLLFN